MNSSFIGIPEIDIFILNKLSDRDLLSACRINKYTRNLCQDDYFWRERINLYLGKELIQEKHVNLTWRRWYSFWRRHEDDIGINMIEVLNLTLLQGYIFLVTRDSIVPGSEAFQTINITLPKAFSSGNREIVDYFMIQFEKIAKKYFELNLHINPLLNYGKTILIALEHGYNDITIQLLGIMNQDREKLAEEDYDMSMFDRNYYKIAITLGKLEMTSFFNQTFLPISPKYIEETDYTLKESFLCGLIQGNHNKEAKEIFLEIFDKWEDSDASIYLYELLIEPAIKAKNQDFIAFLNSSIPSGEEKYKRIYREQTPGLHQNIKGLSARSYFLELLYFDPELAMDYYEKHRKEINFERAHAMIKPTCSRRLFDELIKQNLFRSRNINYKTCSAEIIMDIILNINDRKIIIEIITYSIIAGRYDVILNLDFNQPFYDQGFWGNLITSIDFINYKDLYLYMLLLFIRNYPQAAQEYLDHLRISDLAGPLEMYLLLKEIKVKDLVKYDLYSILILPYEK